MPTHERNIICFSLKRYQIPSYCNKTKNTITYRISNTFDKSIYKINKIKGKFGDEKL